MAISELAVVSPNLMRSPEWHRAVFVVDEGGIIRAKFEGAASVRGLESAVRKIVD